MTDRRTFLKMIPVACLGLAATSMALAAPETLSESDPAAQALGYRKNSSRVDGVKYPKHAAGQACRTCMFYQGSAGAANAPCPLFGGKLVAGGGWCNSWAKKA